MARTRQRLEEWFFGQLKDWSEIKLRILTKYFNAYQKIRGGTNPVIYYVDGFAGTGQYGEDEASGEGSPLRMARLSQQIANEGRPCRLVCINVESNQANFVKLQRTLAGFDPDLAQVRQGDFADHIPEIMQMTSGRPAVFFLDPFGVKRVTVHELRPILVRPDTEVLIALMTRRLRMLAGFEDSIARDRDAKLRLVSEVLGEPPEDPNPEWLRAWHAIGDAIRWEAWAAKTYVARLQRENPRLEFGVTYPVRETFRSNPKYYLAFLTRSEKAVLVMNDLVCTEDDDLYERTEVAPRNGQLSLFGDAREEERAQRLEALLDEMRDWGLNHHGCSRYDLIKHFILRDFGVLKRKHYRDAFARLQKQGRVRLARPGGIEHAPLTFS